MDQNELNLYINAINLVQNLDFNILQVTIFILIFAKKSARNDDSLKVFTIFASPSASALMAAKYHQDTQSVSNY